MTSAQEAIAALGKCREVLKDLPQQFNASLWQYEEAPNVWHSYDIDSAAKIEEQYQHLNTQGNLCDGNLELSSRHFARVINFSNMEQVNVSTGNRRKIQRKCILNFKPMLHSEKVLQEQVASCRTDVQSALSFLESAQSYLGSTQAQHKLEVEEIRAQLHETLAQRDAFNKKVEKVLSEMGAIKAQHRAEVDNLEKELNATRSECNKSKDALEQKIAECIGLKPIDSLSSMELKQLLTKSRINFKGCTEKSELVSLYKEHQNAHEAELKQEKTEMLLSQTCTVEAHNEGDMEDVCAELASTRAILNATRAELDKLKGMAENSERKEALESKHAGNAEKDPIDSLSSATLKKLLIQFKVDFSGCNEKSELVSLYKSFKNKHEGDFDALDTISLDELKQFLTKLGGYDKAQRCSEKFELISCIKSSYPRLNDALCALCKHIFARALQNIGSYREAVEMWRDPRMGGIVDRAYIEDITLRPKMQKILRQTSHAGHGSRCSPMKDAIVTKVLTVVNRDLWEKYQEVKDALKRHLLCMKGGKALNLRKSKATQKLQKLCSADVYWVHLDEAINEVWAFHGTSTDSAKNITKEGFDPERCKNGLYGQGFYTAQESCKSFQYTDVAKQARSGSATIHTEGCIVLCRATLGNPEHVTESDQNKTQPAHAYDSVVVNPGIEGGPQGQDHQEFVLFSTRLAYPDFIIYFKIP